MLKNFVLQHRFRMPEPPVATESKSKSGLDPATEFLATLTGSSVAYADTVPVRPTQQDLPPDSLSSGHLPDGMERTAYRDISANAATGTPVNKTDLEKELENQSDKNGSGSVNDENAHSTNKPIKNICVDNTIGRSWAKDWNIFNANEDAHTSTKLGRERPDVQQKIIDMATENGINPRLMLAFVDIETGGLFNPRAHNDDSGASGLLQFIPSNWEAYGLGKNGEYKFDIEKNILAGIQMLKENIDYFHKNIDSSREPTVAELYLMHQQGSGGARALMKNPNMLSHEALRTLTKKDKHGNIKHVYSEKGALAAIRNNLLRETNKQANTITSREFIESWNNKVNRRSKDFY